MNLIRSTSSTNSGDAFPGRTAVRFQSSSVASRKTKTASTVCKETCVAAAARQETHFTAGLSLVPFKKPIGAAAGASVIAESFAVLVEAAETFDESVLTYNYETAYRTRNILIPPEGKGVRITVNGIRPHSSLFGRQLERGLVYFGRKPLNGR